ncbi:MAG: hypothetical protein Q4F00_07465 [bacterium]|nr:hypothetical protein [bacterium]
MAKLLNYASWDDEIRAKADEIASAVSTNDIPSQNGNQNGTSNTNDVSLAAPSSDRVNNSAESQADDKIRLKKDSANYSVSSPSSSGHRAAVSSVPGGVSDDGLQDLWGRYLNYSAACLKFDMVAGLAPVNSKRWVLIADNFENVINQGTRLLMVDPEVERLASRLMPNQTMQYGWPLVALETRDGLKVAPLFVMDIASPPYPANSITVYGEPAINSAVVRSMLSGAGDVAFLRSQLGEGMPEGAVAIKRYVESICQLLGLQHQELDAFRLSKGIPQEPGVYNCAMVVIVESSPTARTLMEELTQLSERNDWRDTSAAALFGITKPPEKGHDSMPVMPWSTDEAFEEGLQLVRQNAVTVFNMNKRDVIDQLCATVACNAWNDGESLLVVTDNEKRQNELVKLAHDVHDGMLVRASCDMDFEVNPLRQGKKLSVLASELLEKVQATLPSLPSVMQRVDKDVSTASDIRKIAIEGAKRRDRLIKEKQILENKRLELAKKIWRNGVASGNFEVSELGKEIKNLQRTWFCAGFRTAALMRRINAKKNVTLQDVLDWCLTVLEIKKVEEGMVDLRDPDKYNVSSANYRWASTGIGLVSARVSERLSTRMDSLENLKNTKARDLQTKQAISDAVYGLRCWVTDYESASAFFVTKSCMFDIVILDDAQRYSLAQVLPLLYRARRAVIVGDMSAAAQTVYLSDDVLRKLSQEYLFERNTMLERCLDYSVSNVLAAFSHI